MNEEELLRPRKAARRGVSCEFQRECWKTIRAPIARKNHIYLPYICSYQSEGDLEKCGLRETFEEKKRERLIANGEV